MAAVFALSRHGTKFCRKSSFPKFSVPRSRKFYIQRNGQARNQYGKGIGRNEIEPEIPKDVSKLRMIMRPLGFTIMTGAVSFGACSILHYERVRNLYIQGSFERHWPISRFPKLFGVRDVLNRWWNSLPGGSKTAAGIIFLNTTVFLLWRIPRMQYFMYKWFTTSPGAVSSITLLSSTFSHMDLWHLAINMFVLWSFAPHIEALLGKEQFIAFYITGGVTASFASTAYRIIAASSVLGASLGASGALLAVLSYVCINQPDTRLALVFLPFFTFSAAKGLLAIVGIDVAGLLFRWKLFDHAAHLGGVLFGAWYLKSGHHYLWEKRGWLVSQWHKIREGYKRT